MTNIVKRDRADIGTSRTSTTLEWRGQEPDDILNFQRLLHRLFKRKHQIALIFVIVLVPAAIATYLTTPLYRSTALVQVNPAPVQVMPYRDVADSSSGGANIDNYMGTQEKILSGSTLRARVAARLQSSKDESTRAESANLGGRFEVKKIEKSELFELSYLAPRPEMAAEIANLYAEEYGKQNFELRQATRVKAEQDLKKELDALEGRLQLSEKELMAYAQGNDILNLEQGQVDPLQQRLSSFTQQLAESEGLVAVAKASLTTMQQTTVADFPQRLVNEQIAQLEGSLLQVEQDLTTLRSQFGENWPAVVEKRNEMTLVRDQLGREKAAVLARHLEQARLDLQGAEARHSMAAMALADQKGMVNRFHDASIQYNIFKREVDTNRNLYDGLLERLRQTGVMAGFQFGNIHVVESARPSRIADSPKILWNLALASLLGLALGVSCVILLDSWDHSISTLEEAEQLSPLPSLGSVPLFSKSSLSTLSHTTGNGKSTALVPGQDYALSFDVTESIRAVCASILLSRSDERPRVIVITSATHAEGKTTLVTHLGRAFADAGSRTLLVEADMRKPDLSRAFSIGNEDGLSLYLAGHVSPWPKIQETGIANLSLVASGPVPPNPAALLQSEKLDAFLKVASADYDVVIVDAPPLSLADARILGMKADGVVLVVRAGRTAKNQVRRAFTQLDGSGANVLGMVLNGTRPDRAELAHYGYYQPQG